MELFVDGLDVVRDRADGAGDGVVQQVDLARDAMDGGGEAAKVGCTDEVRRRVQPAGDDAGMVDVDLARVDGDRAVAGGDADGADGTRGSQPILGLFWIPGIGIAGDLHIV